MTTKKKIYLYLGIFIIIFILFFALVIPYILKEIQKKSEDLIFLKQNLITLQGERKNLKQLETTYQNYQHALEKIEALFVNSEVPVDFIDFLESTAQLSQQTIDISLVSTKETEDESWLFLSFQVSAIGSFPNFLKFLTRLENSPYLIEIINLNIKESILGETEPGEPQGYIPTTVESNILIKVFSK